MADQKGRPPTTEEGSPEQAAHMADPHPRGEGEEHTSSSSVSRRDFLKSSGLGVVTGYLAGQRVAQAQSTRPASGPTSQVVTTKGTQIEMEVNGKKVQLQVEPRTTLAEALREKLHLTGTKVICDRGACGGCTVQVNGDAVCSCMMLAINAHKARVTTIEGLAQGEKLHPLQQAFVECDALQCGYCTPGMVMSCKTLLDHNPSPTREDVQQAVAGNLCRCGTYPHVFDATLLAAKRMKKKG